MLRGFLLGIAVTILAIVVYGYFVVTSGDVPAWAANAKPVPLEGWVATTSLRANLARYAPKGANPVPLTEANLMTGIDLYGRNCAACHGTPGSGESGIAKGEYPKPPQFGSHPEMASHSMAEMGSHSMADHPPGHTFWIIKNGIRLTGMPAWQGVLNDQEIWTLVLFLDQKDKLPPAAQQAWENLGKSQTSVAMARP
jgi:mono/diheme cytochrome c family protein